MLLTLAACSNSDGLTGRTISIFNIIGAKATVTKTDAKEYAARKGLRMGANYGVSTGEETYLYLNLDDKSLAKMDDLSKVGVAQISDNKLRLDLVDGAILINERKESQGELEIRVGNAAIGIRGTFVTVNSSVADTTIFIIEGAIDVTTTSGETTSTGSLKRVTVSNDVVSVDDLTWSMLDSFTRDCILEYHDDLSDVLSEDDFDAIFNRGNLITVSATVIDNNYVYGDRFAALYAQYNPNTLNDPKYFPMSMHVYGVLFDPQIQLPNGEFVSEAHAWSNNDHIWREMGLSHSDMGSNYIGSINWIETGIPQKDVILTGYLYLNENYTGEIKHEFIDKNNSKYDWSSGEHDEYLYEPNGPYNFEILSFEETEQ